MQCGVVGSQGYDEILVATYTGKIFGLTTEPIDKNHVVTAAAVTAAATPRDNTGGGGGGGITRNYVFTQGGGGGGDGNTQKIAKLR